jgi:hypothetical protein
VSLWKLTTQVYSALGALTVITIAVAVWRWDDPWARDWLPNFIAEWSGLFIAVAIVDRLLSHARRAEEEARREPWRRQAGIELAQALDELITTAVHDYARDENTPEEPTEPASVFFDRWSQSPGLSESARDPTFVYVLANAFQSAANALASFQPRYESALEPEERAHVAELANLLSDDEKALGSWAEDIDPDFERRGIMAGIPPMTPDQVARNVANRCQLLSPYFAAVAADHQSLTGHELTTQTGWDAVRLSRLVGARRIFEQADVAARLADLEDARRPATRRRSSASVVALILLAFFVGHLGRRDRTRL